jgi:hypothetical protein
MSQFKPTRSETAMAKCLAARCEHNAKLASGVGIFDRKYYEKKADVYATEVFALSQRITARGSK